MNKAASWLSELLALLFGMLVILIVFGDQVQTHWLGHPDSVGALDALFGARYWQFMDIVYPLASFAVFMLHGRTRGIIRFSWWTVLPVLLFVAVSGLIQLDDVIYILRGYVTFSDAYWSAVRWTYAAIATASFLAFGEACAMTRKRKDIKLH